MSNFNIAFLSQIEFCSIVFTNLFCFHFRMKLCEFAKRISHY